MHIGLGLGVNRQSGKGADDAYFNDWFLVSGTWDEDGLWRNGALWNDEWFLERGYWHRGGYWINAEAW